MSDLGSSRYNEEKDRPRSSRKSHYDDRGEDQDHNGRRRRRRSDSPKARTGGHRSRHRSGGNDDRDGEKDPTELDMARYDERLAHLSRSLDLKEPIKAIDSNSYFEKSAEFRNWLREEKGMYLSEMPSSDARSYFHKFVKAWNRAKLPFAYYEGTIRSTLSSGPSTSYKWNFASKISAADSEKAASVRDSIDTHTNVKFDDAMQRARGYHKVAGGATGANDVAIQRPKRGSEPFKIVAGPQRERDVSTVSSSSLIGPSLPGSALENLHLVREAESNRQDSARRAARETQRGVNRRDREDLDELVPRSTGREAQMEKRRALNSKMRDYRERDPTGGGLEIEESSLMGGGDDFESFKRRQEMNNSRKQSAKEAAQEEKRAVMQDRYREMKSKDSETMEMFKALAKERFG